MLVDIPLEDSTRLHPKSNEPVPLLRSVTVAGDRSPSTRNRLFQYNEATEDDGNDNDETAPSDGNASKLRTFRGWKRDTAHLDKSRLTKGLMRSNVRCPHIKRVILLSLIVSSVFLLGVERTSYGL